MPRKGTVTKDLIVEKAARLFNSLGYYRASMSDVMRATGLEKGGIYNHFGSKDELAVAAFEYSVRLAGGRLKNAIENVEQPIEKLIAFIDGFKSLVYDPPIEGGCPLLNCAIENDDGNPLLKEKVRNSMESLLKLVESLVKAAQDAGQIDTNKDAKQTAMFLISSLEGGIMLSRLYEDPNKMEALADSLKEHLMKARTTNN